MKLSKDIWFWLSVAMLAVLALVLLYPLINTLKSSFLAAGAGGSGWAQLLADSKYKSAISNTIGLGLIVTFTATFTGAPLAFFTARYSFPFKALVALLPMTTLVVPEVIAAQTWLMVLGNNGLLTRWLEGFGVQLPSFYGWFGLVTVMSRPCETPRAA